jgi:ubiquinone/menaquinone biosynthesis C-methylase UbiE
MSFDPEAHTAEQRQAWSEAAVPYEAMSRLLFSAFSPAFVDFLRPEGSLLDVACGPGAVALAAHSRGARVTAVDLAPGMIELARAAAPDIDWRVMNAEELSFPDKSFDAVSCQLGVMLFARPEKALREMARVGRRAACLVQGTAEGMVFSSLLLRTMIKHAPELKVPGAPTLFAFGGHGVLKGAMEKAGFTDVEEKRLSGAYEFSSAEDYWKTFTTGGGRTARMLATLPKSTQAAIKAEVLDAAEKLGCRLPWEVVMARGSAT